MKNVLLYGILILLALSTTISLKADPMNTKPQSDTKLRWADDNLIYTGEVNSWSFGVLVGIEDAAIDVDYFAGDTLRAIIASPDSTFSTFRSNNNGQTWSLINTTDLRFDNGTQPRIVHGPDSTYHIFIRTLDGIGNIYTEAHRTSDDSYIIGTGNNLAAPGDSVKSYSVCTDRRSNHDYSVFVAYQRGQGGAGEDDIYLTQTSDLGQTWSTPSFVRAGGAMYPDITYGNDSTLYVAFLQKYAGKDTTEIMLRRTMNFGATWTSSVPINSDTFPKMAPQVAAAYDGSGDVWVIWSLRNYNNPNNDFALLYSLSEDYAMTWSSPSWCNSVIDSNEILPSIAVNDVFGSTSNKPYVTFLRTYYDWSGPLSVHSCEWTGSGWSADSIYADSNTTPTKPIQTFIAGGEPAIAYVGPNSENVYFDSRIIPAGIDEKEYSPSNGEIECSIDKNIITGTATLKYTLPGETNVDISVANILGQTVATLDNGLKEGSEHTISVSAENLSQGIYFIVVKTENGLTGTVKFAVLK
jgi:hypothetical protein